MTIYYLTYKTTDNVTDANVTANTVQEAMEVLKAELPDIQIVCVVDTETNLKTIIDHYDYFRGRKLQDWYHIEIETRELPEEQQHFEQGTSIWVTTDKRIYFCSRIHVNKRVKIGADSYSGLFTNSNLLNDKYIKVYERFGTDIYAS